MFLGAGGGGDAYQIEKSLRFVPGDTTYLNRTPSSSTTNQKQFTFSFWAKPTSTSGDSSFFACGSSSQTTGMLQMWLESGRFIIYSYGSGYYRTDALYRDPSAWYHFVVAVDSNLATTSDIWKLWVNGVRVTDWLTETDPAQDKTWIVNTTTNHEISGIRNSGGTLGNYWDGCLAEYYLIDGQALTASNFGKTNATGQWVPKDCSEDLTYGTNGFYLKFDNISDLGEDSSGEDNDWTSNNFGATSYDGPWSADGSYTNSPTGPWSKAFDNDMGSYDKGVRTYSTSDSTFTFDVNNRPTWSNKIEIFFRKYSGTANVNGGSDFTTLITGTPASYWEGWLDISSIAGSSGTLSTIYISDVGSNYVSLQGIRLDGRMLLDGVASPSPISIDTPTTFDDEGNGTGNYATLNPLNPGASTLSNGNLEASGTGDLPTIIPGSGQWYYEIDGTGYDWDGTVDDFTDAAGVYNFGQRPFEETVTTGYLALNTYNLDTTKILSGTYEGNGDADGPVIWMNATPATLRISSTNDPPEAGDAVTFSLTTVDRLAGGFKIRNATTNNANGTTYYWSATSTRAFKHANAQSNE